VNGTPAVCLIGFGEVGQVLAADLAARGVSTLSAWDRQFADAASAPRRAAARSGVRVGSDAADALSGAVVAISAVTASECVSAARQCAPSLAPGTFYLDLNSVAPATKLEAAALIEAAGGRYVEAAVMSPISPKRIAAPILLGGPRARGFQPLAAGLGFSGAEVFADETGRASAAKMCRSVMIKGIEALLTESLLSARHYGVERTVLESLEGMLPVGDWQALSRYMISRSLQHGTRRAEEMREVARTVEAAGITPWMSLACAARQDWAADSGRTASVEPLEALLDAVLKARVNAPGAPRC
jgi:3-hydroxyisobutyrate dehydrogenase-like beta-hydroxyacid dehydrogenase